MSRDKQIEEMAKIMCKDCAAECAAYEPCILAESGKMCDDVLQQAESLYNAGYRKAEDVAREIFEEIRTQMRKKISIYEGMAKTFSYDADFYKGRVKAYIDAINVLTELNKKYESEEK